MVRFVNGEIYNWMSSFDDVMGEIGVGFGVGGCGGDSFLRGMVCSEGWNCMGLMWRI